MGELFSRLGDPLIRRTRCSLLHTSPCVRVSHQESLPTSKSGRPSTLENLVLDCFRKNDATPLQRGGCCNQRRNHP